MSEPKHDWDNPFSGATHEIISAMSALNMLPEPMAEPKGEYLSQSDFMAEHAYRHLTAAVDNVNRATQFVESFDRLLYREFKRGGVTPEAYDRLHTALHPDDPIWKP